MESNWAAEHLQVIRTLMERSALYRRALAPVMTYNGAVGLAAAIGGWLLKIESPGAFIEFWSGTCLVALVGSFLLVRRQALKESEPFWSPPTRRVTQAVLPPLAVGCILSALIFFRIQNAMPEFGQVAGFQWLPLAWVVLYGCAIHAAGFFMPRGAKWFGWGFVWGGAALIGVGIPGGISRIEYAYGIMGFFFGVLHLAYGAYLYVTEQRANAE